MIRSALAVALAVTAASSACGPSKTFLTVSAPSPHVAAPRLAEMPGFVVLPAIDRRPRAERAGRGAELGYIMASSGAAMSRFSGAAVLAGDDAVAWHPHAFTGERASPSLAVASDVGRALGAASGRPVVFAASTPELAAAAAHDGAVLVTVVVDHIARVQPSNRDFSQTKTQQGNYEVTTTITSSSTFGPFWTVSLQVELAEVRDRRIARRLVRHAAAHAPSPTCYSEAVRQAVGHIVDAVAAEWAPATLSLLD